MRRRMRRKTTRARRTTARRRTRRMMTRTTARAQLSHPSGLHRDSAQCTSLYGFTSQPGPACGYHVSVLYTALILINGSTDTETRE